MEIMLRLVTKVTLIFFNHFLYCHTYADLVRAAENDERRG